MSYIGTTKIGKMFLGTTEVGKAYLGDDLVFQNGVIPPTPSPVFHDRVRFDGTAYIQTDIVPPSNGSIRMSTGGETRKGNQGIFNARNANNNVVFAVWMNNNTGANKRSFSHRYDNTSTGTGNPEVNNWTNRAGIFLNPSKWGTSTTTLNTVKGSSPATQGIQLGAESSSYRYTGALGWVYIYDSTAQNATTYADLRDNYTPIYTLRPCEYNGEVGFWCVETSTFYGNSAGSGTLTVEDD